MLEQISFDISHVICRPVSNMLSLTSMLENNILDEKMLKEYSNYIQIIAKELNGVYSRKK